MPSDSTFDIEIAPDIAPGQTLLVGLATPGVGGLTAVDYLVRHMDTTDIGHITPEALPAITPVQEGQPRHHTRVYNLVDVDLTVLVGELFVPAFAARSFANCLLEWANETAIEEIAFLHSVPYPHEAEDHGVFYVATEEYRESRLTEARIQPLKGGALDGVPGELMSRSLSGDAPPTCVYVTPAHPPGPNIDSSLLLLDAVEAVYGVSVDMTELENLSDEVHQHYAALSEQLAALRDGNESIENREFGVDRMYM